MADDVNTDDLNSAVTNTLTLYAKAFVQAIQEVLLNKGKFATGDTYNSLRYEVNPGEAEKIEMQIFASDVLKYIEAGRLPASRLPNVQDIIKWIQAKGISPRTIKRNSINFKNNSFPKPLTNAYATNKKKGIDRHKVTKFGSKKTNINSYKAQKRLGFIIAHAIARDGIKAKAIVKPIVKIVFPELQKELIQTFSKGYRTALGKTIKDAITADSNRVNISVNF